MWISHKKSGSCKSLLGIFRKKQLKRKGERIFPFQNILSFLYPPESLLFITISNVGVFLLTYLILSVLSGYLIKIDFLKIKLAIEVIAWIFIKFLIFLYLFIIPLQISIVLRITFPLVIVIFMSPITIYYLRNIFYISDSLFLNCNRYCMDLTVERAPWQIKAKHIKRTAIKS